MTRDTLARFCDALCERKKFTESGKGELGIRTGMLRLSTIKGVTRSKMARSNPTLITGCFAFQRKLGNFFLKPLPAILFPRKKVCYFLKIRKIIVLNLSFFWGWVLVRACCGDNVGIGKALRYLVSIGHVARTGRGVPDVVVVNICHLQDRWCWRVVQVFDDTGGA